MALRVLICDERALVSDGLRSLLSAEQDIEIVGTTSVASQGLSLAESQKPNVVVTGLRLRGMQGSEFIRRLRGSREEASPPVVVYAVGELDEVMADVIRAGANGLLSDQSGRSELVMTIRAVAAGQAMLGPDAARRMLTWFRRTNAPVKDALPMARSLTVREREVLILTAQGLSVEDIAVKLFISAATVRTHLYRLRGKLQLRDRAQLVSFAYEAGMMTAA
ncbi:LuxR C-terminal-related transcriptional regulator [Winogradskya humida]|uniref:DNA-binding response regulator n=1 Tax=Winogradskya humida TaxID=113566 RepID=A0ABQ3ZGX8_9ACTN|nr:response regulator transcription factor [Actinoplanes humidus]GIE17818.1 DNA-binding response regulator [Actinoplanes humidus]